MIRHYGRRGCCQLLRRHKPARHGGGSLQQMTTTSAWLTGPSSCHLAILPTHPDILQATLHRHHATPRAECSTLMSSSAAPCRDRATTGQPAEGPYKSSRPTAINLLQKPLAAAPPGSWLGPAPASQEAGVRHCHRAALHQPSLPALLPSRRRAPSAPPYFSARAPATCTQPRPRTPRPATPRTAPAAA